MITEILAQVVEPARFFGIELINTSGFLELVARFIFNTLVVFALIRYLYYPVAKRKEYFFTFMLVSTIVFLISFSLIKVDKLGIGVALGLFALFGILRFRTRQIPIKEMTYLFLVIGISVINALVTLLTSYVELLFINTMVLLVAWIGEKYLMQSKENSKTIVYEKIELVKPENRVKLIEDLENRTGLKIYRIEIGRINFLRDTARIRIFYTPKFDKDHLDDNEISERINF
ncbi:MAG: DUF4956 domain-containing protein [Bacteroidetes bacterium]|nr:DUF4956 domain-containing protein [Bacteroidota bacterium]PWI46251.1 MAG: DUF4956 domain-containing protein [Candidatus Heimdallarchaeota archaeon B3_Heim]